MTKKLYVWACDYSENSGEGKLARLFIKNLNAKNIFQIKLNQRNIIKSKYLSTLLGIVYCWKRYFKDQNVCYLNYLPLWNFVIFFFLPPKTMIGPITGGANFDKSVTLNYIIRGSIFPILYKISELALNLRDINIIFSTSLLKKYLFKKTIKKSIFNFVIKKFSKKKNKKRKKIFDFIIYYRDHKNKKKFFPYNFIKKLIELNFKISIVGDRLKMPKVKNFGYLPNYKVSKLQSQSKYTIASGENLFSFFVLECLSNNVKIIVEKNLRDNITFFKKNFIKLNFDSLKSIKELKKLR